MKSYTLNSILFIALTLTISSCKKENEHDDHSHDTTATTVITVSSLNENDTIQSGEEVHFNGSITSTVEMHGYQLVVKNITTGLDVFTTDEHSHALTYNIHDHWTNNVSDTSEMDLKITVVNDHDGNLTTKTIRFVCLP